MLRRGQTKARIGQWIIQRRLRRLSLEMMGISLYLFYHRCNGVQRSAYLFRYSHILFLTARKSNKLWNHSTSTQNPMVMIPYIYKNTNFNIKSVQ